MPTIPTQVEFDAAYWASQPPEVAALHALLNDSQRADAAAQLATQGLTIDVPIMVWGWSPYLVMTMRAQFGYTWVPSALQPPIAMAPGVVESGVAAYDPLHPPPGSIKVSTSILDYPPFTPAPPPTQTPAGSDPVGLQSVGNIYLSVRGETYPDGAVFTDARGTFEKHLLATPFGANAYWEKIA